MTIRHIPAVATPYAHIINTANSQWWNTDTAAFEAFDAGNLADYAVLSGTQFGTTGIWPWMFPSAIAAGQYTVLVYDGDDDSLIEAGVVDWDGAALNVAADVRKVTGTAVANVDDFKATGFLTTLGTNAPANWINAASIASNAFTTAKFADGVFTAAKFSSGAFDAVWTVSTRTLSSFGTLIADTYAYFIDGTRADAFKATGYAVAGDQMDIVNTPNATAVTAIQSGLATSAAQTTAQNDLDVITGSDGVTIATTQGNYAPAKAGDAMTLTSGGLDAITAWTADITGSLSGSVGSVTAAVTTDGASRTASKATATEIRTAVGLASANLDSQLGDIGAAADGAAVILATLTENVSGLRFTEKALEEAPTGSGGGGDDAATIYNYFADGSRPDIFKADVSGLSTYDGSDTSGTTTLLSRLSSDRAGYIDKLNVTGTLANTDNASSFMADVSAIPNTTAFNARTLPTADYATIAGQTAIASAITGLNDFDPSSESVTVSTASANAIADATIGRDVANVEDTSPVYSLATVILASQNSSISGTTLTIRKTVGSTYATRQVSVDSDADPITGVGSP